MSFNTNTHNFKNKRRLELRAFIPSLHANKLSAMAEAYGRYDFAYKFVTKAKSNIVSDFSFAQKTAFCLITESNGITSINMDDQDQRRKLNGVIEELYNEFFSSWGYQKRIDSSLELSDAHVISSLPKGYKILKIGQIGAKGDIEYNNHSRWKMWGTISHYNVGKKVEEGTVFSVTKIYSKTSTTKHHRAKPSPIIARKIK
jgi:hypothetical protein